MGQLVCRPAERGFTVCVVYEDPHRELPIYHGPRIAPKFAHPFFPGTVLPYVEAADWSHGRPTPWGQNEASCAPVSALEDET